MESEYQHTVLVVDKGNEVRKAIDQSPQMESVAFDYADNAQSALEKIKEAKNPFSLILSDQHIGDITGIQFLEQAKELTPGSPRFLMTDSFEMETIINAVNKGAIQQYIVKPWDEDNFVQSIQSGIERYKILLENQTLLSLAKRQNTKLYELNCQLMETNKSHNKIIHELDSDIEAIETQIKEHFSQMPASPDDLVNEITGVVKAGSGLHPGKLETLFSDTIWELYGQFNDLAQRNGFEMPGADGEPV